MDALSNVDRFVALLRLKLAERARTHHAKSAPAARARTVAEQSPQARITALTAQQSLDERSLRRAVIEQLLSERLGTELANEPRFQQVIEQVTTIIANDRELAGLLDAVLHGARTP